MPSVTNMDLIYAFRNKTDATIIGGTHFIPLSPIDIGILQNYFN